MMTTNRQSLTPNAPIDRLKYIVKTYGEKQPWVVLDTLSVIFNTIGIDNPAAAFNDPEIPRRYRNDAALGMCEAMSGRLRAGLFSWEDVSKAFYDEGVTPTYAVGMQKMWQSWLSYLSSTLKIVEMPAFADGVMREQHEADSIFPWVARELSKLSKHTIAGLDSLSVIDREPPESPSRKTGGTKMAWGAAVDYDTDMALHTDRDRRVRDLRFLVYGDYLRALTSLRRSGNAIAQWAKGARVDIMKLSLAEVLEAIKTYRPKSVVKPGQRGDVVYRFKKTGWVVEELKSKRQLDCETDFLSHCVSGYKGAVASGESVIYSLRDPDGVPYVTMEWQPDRSRFTQVFGKTNSSIGDGVFDEYVFQTGQSNKPPLTREEVPEVVEFIRAMVIEFIDKVKDGETRGIVLAGGSLSGRDLSGRNMEFADLSGMNLRGVSLTGANLTEAHLTGTNLTDADLREANLDAAHARGADLTGANLSGASLRGTHMPNASLENATLTGAKYNEVTRWPDNFDPVAAGAVKVFP